MNASLLKAAQALGKLQIVNVGESSPAVYTRAQYLADSHAQGMAAHRRYFGQFVTPRTVAVVVNRIGRDRLLASTDRHLNDIPLREWDALVSMLPGSGNFAKAGDYYTVAGGVCLAKEAARQFIESIKGEK